MKDRFDRERVGIGSSLNERHHSLRMNEVIVVVVVVSRTFVLPTAVLFYYFNSNLVLDKYQVSFRFVTRSDFYVTGFTLNLKVTYQYRTSSGSLLYKTEYLSFSQLGQTRTIIFPGQGQMGAFTYEIFTVTGNVYKN